MGMGTENCKPKLSPFYDLCKLILWISDLFYMFYQLNVLKIDDFIKY